VEAPPAYLLKEYIMDLDITKIDWANMRRAIDAQVALLAEVPAALYKSSEDLLLGDVPGSVYLTGCGDSFYCGMAARYAVCAWSGLQAESIGALEFARYAIRDAPREALLVAVSNSGEVARTVEAVMYAQQAGLATLGISYKGSSRLAQHAAESLIYSYPDAGFGPGTLSYTASLLALLVTGMRLGERTGRGNLESSSRRVEALSDLSKPARDTIGAAEEAAIGLADALSSAATSFYLGAGPNLGTAHFAMAKMIESCGHNAVPQELEEWAHEQFFCTKKGTFTTVLAPPGASLGRAREQLQAIRDMDGTSIVVCDVADLATQALADHVFPVYGSAPELISPVLYALPLQVLAYHAGIASGKAMLGFDDAWRREVNMRQILGSNIPQSLPPLGGA
jgi:glucosamine 6-phosphate synthetase-like amidotransferase/phosphosugar isomerase protein